MPHSKQTILAGWSQQWLPSSLTAAAVQRPLLWLCLRTAPLLLLFVLLDHGFRWAGQLSADGYSQPWLSIPLAQHLGPWLIAAVIAIAMLLWRYGQLTTRWDVLEHGNQLRLFTVFLALLMAWPFTTLDYNYYFDQGYLLDRGLILLLLTLLWWRPVFIFPLLLMLFTVMGQLKQPDLGGSILEHKLQVLHVLVLFAATFLLHAVTASRRSDSFWFLSCCIVAGAYWQAAQAKLLLGWLDFGQLYQIPAAAYAHGWLGFVDADSIAAFAQALKPFDFAMGVSVLAIEAGCLLFLWKRPLSLALLIAVILFHLGVFVLFGFLFWTWMLLDAALLLILLRDWKARNIRIYSRAHLLLSLLLIGFIGLWARPPALGWFDTRLSYTYSYQAIGASGTRYILPADFFGPYADAFVLAPFSYLSRDHKVLTGSYGVTMNRMRANVVQQVTTLAELSAAEETYGVDRYRVDREARFHQFLSQYLSHRNAHGERLSWMGALQPPPQLWSYARGNIYRDQEPIRELLITEVTSLYDGQQLNILRRIELARLDIPDPQPGITP